MINKGTGAMVATKLLQCRRQASSDITLLGGKENKWHNIPHGQWRQKVFFKQGQHRGWGWGGLQPPHFFGWLDHFFFYFSKPGLSFTKKVCNIILCQKCGPLRKRSLILICPFRSNLFFLGFSRTDTASWGSLSLGLFLNRRLDFRLRNNGI